jgi:DNA-binding SARP family transcriptional activator
LASLSLYLFGNYQIAKDGKALSHTISAKGRALLAYLAIEAQAQSRE